MAAELLRRGASGMNVKRAQHALNYHFASKLPPVRADSAFGPITERRVQEFQRRNGLTNDGIIGPITRAKLFELALARLRLRLKRVRQSAVAATGARTQPQQTSGGPGAPAKQLLVDWGQSFSFNPLASPDEHVFTTELKLALKNNGDDDSIIGRLSLDAAAGQPGLGDWEFSAELEAPIASLSLIGPLEANLFTSPGFQLNPLALSVGAGLKVGVNVLGDRIGIFAQGDLKLQYDPEAKQGQMSPSGSGVVEVKF